MSDQYEREEYRKFKLFLEAAQLKGCRVSMNLMSTDPSMSITVEAYVLAKLIKEKYE